MLKEGRDGSLNIPIEENDVNQNVQLTLTNEPALEYRYHHVKDENIFPNQYIQTKEVFYVISDDTNKIIIHVDDEYDTKLYEADFTMNEEQLNIYDKFANEEEPLLLINFEPFDLLKLYIHAYLEDNQEVLSNLFVSEHNLQQKLYEFLTMNDKFLLRLDNNKEEAILFSLQHGENVLINFTRNEQDGWSITSFISPCFKIMFTYITENPSIHF
ncbi:MAG TPA: hypothetical protein VK061_06275 [Bacillota bacterium]|nr:hypothetical protein [Bacillota bacterium]